MIIYGRNAVIEALSADNVDVKYVYVQEGITKDAKISQIYTLAKQNSIHIEQVSPQQLTKITKTNHTQGIAADIFLETFSSLKAFFKKDVQSEHDAFIYITESQLSHNMGAIARTAEVAGFKGIIIPPKQSISAEAIKISTGGLFRIPIIQESIFNVIKTAKQNEYFVFGIERGGQTYYSVDTKGKSLFVIGGEDKSITAPVRKQCDTMLSIPQFGAVNSLNMSVAAGIIMFDYIRQSHDV